MHAVVVFALCQPACSFTAATVGNGPCTRVLPALDATYAGASAAFGIAVISIDQPDHHDDHAITDMVKAALGVPMIVSSILLGISAAYGFHHAGEC